MEGQNCHFSARFQHTRQLFQQGIQYFIFMIHVDAKRLKRTLTGFSHHLFVFFLRQEFQCRFDLIMKLRGRPSFFLSPVSRYDTRRNLFCIWLIRIFCKHTNQLLFRHRKQPVGSAFSLLRIHAQVQRPIGLVGKTALRIVDLHRGNAKICQHKIKFSRFLCHLIDICKI